MRYLAALGRALKKWWMLFAHALGWLNTRVLLSVFYLVILSLPSLILRLLRKDPLRRAFRTEGSYWQDKAPLEHTLDRARRQF
jgi:hypothetical protein